MGSLHCLVLYLAVAAVAAHAQSVLRMVSEDGGDDLYCDSWRLAVETNNARNWATIPARCVDFIEAYMNGDRYKSDSDVVTGESVDFANTVVIAGDGKDVWIFDVDETLLSNLPYYAAHGYGSESYNETLWNEWVYLARAPALPASLRLYRELQSLGLQLVLLTGRGEAQRNITAQNLLFAGYHSWERLIVREVADTNKSAVVFKSEKRDELAAQGYRIHGNSGDQWSDLLGSLVARRSFKLPNPMYYIQ